MANQILNLNISFVQRFDSIQDDDKGVIRNSIFVEWRRQSRDIWKRTVIGYKRRSRQHELRINK